jgi:hypothetical protein
MPRLIYIKSEKKNISLTNKNKIGIILWHLLIVKWTFNE